jgi:hypothetical protein
MIDPSTIHKYIDKKILKEENSLMDIKDGLLSKTIHFKNLVGDILNKPESERTSSDKTKLDNYREYIRWSTKRVQDILEMNRLSKRMITYNNESLLKIVDFRNSFVGKRPIKL